MCHWHIVLVLTVSISLQMLSQQQLANFQPDSFVDPEEKIIFFPERCQSLKG
jgi:hypothetical protein